MLTLDCNWFKLRLLLFTSVICFYKIVPHGVQSKFIMERSPVNSYNWYRDLQKKKQRTKYGAQRLHATMRSGLFSGIFCFRKMEPRTHSLIYLEFPNLYQTYFQSEVKSVYIYHAVFVFCFAFKFFQHSNNFNVTIKST